MHKGAATDFVTGSLTRQILGIMPRSRRSVADGMIHRAPDRGNGRIQDAVHRNDYQGGAAVS